MSGEKNETATWMISNIVCSGARKQTVIVFFFFFFFFFLHSSDNVYNVFIVEYCDNLYSYNL